jgi:hypothetical protein
MENIPPSPVGSALFSSTVAKRRLFRTSGGMKFKKKQCVTIYFANTLILER